MSEYAVEGYGAAARNPEYDGPYLDGHRFDPAIQFAYAGDPEKQAQLQKILDETDGTPVLSNGVVTVITGEGDPNVVILTKEPEETKTIVLDESDVDRRAKEQREAELQSTVEPYSDGAPAGTVDTEQENVDREVVDLDGPSGKDETRDGESYNVTEARETDDGTVESDKGFTVN